MDWKGKWPFFIASVFFVSLSGLADGQTGSPSSVRTVSISVDAAPGQVITNSTMPFSAVNYTIAGSSAPGRFSVDANTGELSLAQSIQSDVASDYFIVVSASDSGSPSRVAYETVRVTVDRNLFDPEWTNPGSLQGFTASTSVLETIDFAFLVYSVTATDRDQSSPYNTLTYSIVGEDSASTYFNINPDNGEIRLKSSLLQDTQESYRILVKVTDRGSPPRSATATVTINVGVVRNKEGPVFINTPYTSLQNENIGVGTLITTVTARDNDPSPYNQVTYDIIGADEAPVYFTVNRNTGAITLLRSLAGETKSNYSLIVVAYDSSDVSRNATAEVIIFVTRNLNGPVFMDSPYQASISEYHRVGSSVINTTAVDSDGDTVRYSIVSTDQGITNRFFINPQNGIIYLSQSLENTQVVLFDLTVQASDQRAVNAKVANVQVTILVDLDEYPRFSSNSYTTTIPETFNVSSRVMTIMATDGDLQGQITYMTDGIFPSERLFSLNTASGEITLTRGLMTSDALNLNEYRMNVIAYDSAYPQRRATSTVIITVTRNPNAPQFQAPSYDVTVSETRAVGSSVVNISAVDQDGDPVTYAITADTSGLQNYFYLDPRNGRVIITSDLTKAPQDIYIATVTASDSRGRTASVSLTIRITRITDRPPFFVNTPYRRDLLVSQPINTVIYTVTAQDSDLQGRLEYAAVGLYPALNFFSVNSTTGQISLTNSLRQDNLSSVQYTIRVEAFDTAFPNTRASENVFIVVNRNPNRPVFDSAGYVVTIPETQAVGSSILRMNATDQDGDTVQYYIQNDALGVAANNYFFISAFTGIVYVKQDLTTTNQNRFQFTGLAFDNGVPQNSAPISVIINIERDGGRPQFTQTVYTVQIPETTPVNDTLPVITVTANDADQKGTIRYVATGDGLALAYFWIDQNGRIYVRTSLLGVFTSRFDMTVEAYDDQYPNNRGSSLVNITVIRNPNTPTFGQSQYTASVFEYDPAGTLVVNTTATDRDGDSVRYSLQGSAEVATYFYVDDRTGVVYLRQPVSPNPSNQYSFFVEASDQRSPAKVGQATVLVTVQRDQLPRLTNLPGFIALNEDTAASTSVFTVTAQDSNLRGALRYELIGDGVSPNFFQINNVTGVISTSAGLSQDINRNYVVRVVVYDTAIPSARVTGVLNVTVNRNANAPQCQQSSYVVSVDEGASIGSLVLSVSATDADINDTLRYEMINQGDAANYFFVDGSTGRVYLTRSVSGIQSNQFQFQVQARDRIGQPALQRTANCDVRVTITKDTSLPVFVGLPYIVSPAVLETVAINSTVFSGVRATDADLKGSILYEATGIYPATSFFGVDRNTGVVRVIQNLKSDGLALDTYRLEVIAYDSAKPDARATATVTISVVHNPSIPTFRSQSYVASIDETTNVGLSIIHVNASDADGDTITYSITGDNNNGQSFNFFYIDPRTGVVYLRQPLVGTTINRFDMTVTAVDNGRPSRSNQANLVINVNRIQAPGFVGTPYQTTVREDQTVGASFFSVRASKTNPTGTIMYRVVGLGSAPYFFTVNNVTGDLVVLRDLKQGTESQYTLRMQVYDSAFSTFTSETDIVINMLRNPNSPVLNGPYTTQVGGQATAGTVVINVTATDLDGDRITYQLIGDARCRDVFFIEADTGIVRVNRNLNTVSDARFDCTVQASDNARPTPKTTTSPLTITVVRQNLPVFTTSPYRATVNENDRIGLPVVLVTATKPPPAGTIMYEMVGVYPAPSFFRVDNMTGQIYIAANLSTDPLKTPLYTVRVVAYDVQYPDLRSTADALITVNRNQNGPVFTPSSISLQLPESTNPASWSLTLTVTDPDSKVVTCSIISDQKAQEYFQVDPRTCVVSLRKNLTTDPDLTTTYRITVQATDDGQPAKSSTSLIEVNVPRDRFAPSISNLPAAINVQENAQTGSSVFTVIASDQDKRGNLVYNLIGEFPASLFFQINNATGEITVRLPPNTDSSGRDSYTGIVEVYDSAWPNNRVQGRLTINVARNPNAPVFINSPYSQSIPDTRAPGSLILTVTATDADQDRVRYTLSGTNADYFYVEPDTGRIILTRSLLGGPTQFQLQVVASDSRTPAKTASAPVTIVVNQVQSNPYFVGAPYTVTVPISRPNGSQVIVVEARDNDLGGQIRYGLIGISTAPTYFSLNNATGQVTIQRPLTGNTDTNPRYVLLIQAYDSADPNNVATTTLTVIVDRNENGPVFNQPSYSATINDYDPKGLSVVTVSATDRDLTAPENQVLYSLDSGRAGVDYFTIDPYSGLISIKERVSADLARPATYQLYVIARDPSSNPKSATATVNISVNRNTAPVFDIRTRSTEISAGVPVFTTIIDVTARDPDSPTTLNGQLVYSIVNPEANSVFQINPDTGSISARIDLRNAPNTTYIFTVMASDKGIPSLSDTATVSISIKTIQDPYFQPTEYEQTMPEDTPAGQSVITITTVDPVPGKVVTCSIISDQKAQEYFQVDPRTCVVSVRKNLTTDPDLTTTYRLNVSVVETNGTSPLATAFAVVFVTVNRNLFAPDFSQSQYSVLVRESLPVGAVVLTLSAHDRDAVAPYNTVSYHIVGNDSDSAVNFFRINSTSGQIILNDSLEDASPVVQLTVEARDGGQAQRSQQVQVDVTVLEKVLRCPDRSCSWFDKNDDSIDSDRGDDCGSSGGRGRHSSRSGGSSGSDGRSCRLQRAGYIVPPDFAEER